MLGPHQLSLRTSHSVRSAASKQVRVTALRHPLGPSEVSFPSPSGTGRVAIRIDVQHNPGDLPPVRAVGLGVKQAKIGDKVLLIVAGENGRRGRQVSA